MMGANSIARRIGKKILVPLVNDTTYSYAQALVKSWDICAGKPVEPELDLVSIGVRSGETVIDIGANFGFYTYRFSRVVGREGRVYAFEPVPYTFQTLARVSRILGLHNVALVQKGCSSEAGRVSFTVPVQRSGALMTGQAFISARNDDHAGKETQVRWRQTKQVTADVVALDDFLPPQSTLSMIKCDIEGAELLAFRGAQKLIERNHPTVICEINPWFLDGYGFSLAELIGFFRERGYVLYHYDHKKLIRLESLQSITEDNYVFIHPRWLDRFESMIDETS